MNFQSKCEIIIFLLIIFAHELKSQTPLRSHHETKDSCLTATEIISKYGYPAEAHQVVTKDGYILQLHRIPHGKNRARDNKSIPIYIQHGFQGTSTGFIVLGPKNALAFLLADAGYDVWLGNFRGNMYSRAHISLQPSSAKFWNFTWHEHGVYDIPASIDYICNVTSKEKIVYIGYSMGTTSFLVMISEKPEYQDKVHEAILLAVSAFMEHMKLPLKLIGIIVDYIPPWDILMNRELGSKGVLRRWFVKIFCSRPKFINICVVLTQLAVGFNPRGWPGDLSENIFSHAAGGTSLKTLIHFCQIIHTGKFQQFDYKFWGNRSRYGSLKPPEYNISKAYTKLHIFEGPNDNLSVPEDAAITQARIKSIKKIEFVNHSLFNHLDFLYSKHAKDVLYNRIIQIVRDIEEEAKFH